MRRVMSVVLAAVLLSACGSSDDKVAVSTVAAGKLTACTTLPFAPFEFDESGRDRGIDVDLVGAIAADLGLEPTWVNVSFEDTFTKLEARQCDLIAAAVSITDERKATYAFTDAYFEVNQSLLARKVNSDVTTPEELATKRLGVQEGTTGATYVEQHLTEATAVPFADLDAMLAALRSGSIEGVVSDFPQTSYAAQQDPSLSVVRTFTDVDREQYGFVMLPDASDLRGRINAALDTIRDDGRYDGILRTYLGTATP